MAGAISHILAFVSDHAQHDFNSTFTFNDGANNILMTRELRKSATGRNSRFLIFSIGQGKENVHSLLGLGASIDIMCCSLWSLNKIANKFDRGSGNQGFRREQQLLDIRPRGTNNGAATIAIVGGEVGESQERLKCRQKVASLSGCIRSQDRKQRPYC
ncbi:hypothetical protein HYQ44_014627 [Verticillium longisporum]|nr:hypothetical protein HYQ44_014627 [Verticillium longisporum]